MRSKIIYARSVTCRSYGAMPLPPAPLSAAIPSILTVLLSGPSMSSKITELWSVLSAGMKNHQKSCDKSSRRSTKSKNSSSPKRLAARSTTIIAMAVSSGKSILMKPCTSAVIARMSSFAITASNLENTSSIPSSASMEVKRSGESVKTARWRKRWMRRWVTFVPNSKIPEDSLTF